MKYLMEDVLIEVKCAMGNYPGCGLLTTAFAEEAGEVIKAILDHRQGKGTLADVRKEIIQTMAMCVRLLNEGDPIHSLPPSMFVYLGNDKDQTC